ncbi:MAG: type I-B CRISPR-associated protein Cas8b1/Cst1 [Nitrospirae bacterium]|nr:type I-B CRISPR-associated protein Cas8b1/Cst1 [Nitrospirota bacterium]
MRHKVYMRDWYFNAGIVGFLTIVADGKGLDEVQHLNVGENYVEFDDEVFEAFDDKFVKHAFLKFFSIQAYSQRLNKALTNVNNNMDKTQIREKLLEFEKMPYTNFLTVLGYFQDDIETHEDYIKYLSNTKDKIAVSTEIAVYQKLNETQQGKEFIRSFISERLKGICAHDKSNTYIQDIKRRSASSKKIKNSDLCPSCQVKRASSKYGLSNAVSNIVGFNKKNSNWVWNFNESKLNICPLCALIYNSAFAAMTNVSKRYDGDYYFYFINQNTDMQTLYDSNDMFSTHIDISKDASKLFRYMIKKMVQLMKAKQFEKVSQNINFIEVLHNKDFDVRQVRCYNIYNYNISVKVADFLYKQFEPNGIPTGHYKIKKATSDIKIDEELLALTINNQLNYLSLSKYYYYYLRGYGKYDLRKVTNYVITYIKTIRGQEMDKSQAIVNKAFYNGVDLRNKLYEEDKENQINGIAYGFLNDLKIADREKFLDRYMRTMMSNDLSLKFRQDEMLNDDYFMQFGYSFLNGLLSSKYKSNKEDNDTQGG